MRNNLVLKSVAENEVTSVKPSGEKGNKGYEISFRKSTAYFSKTQTVKAKGVIFAGGVMGTIPLLLKLKKTTLPGLSSRVGHMIRTNNEALIYNTTTDKTLELHKGIAIGSILELDENSHLEPVRYGEGSGFWRINHVADGKREKSVFTDSETYCFAIYCALNMAKSIFCPRFWQEQYRPSCLCSILTALCN